jgi:type II secretory pathway pseudopilin PulG
MKSGVARRRGVDAFTLAEVLAALMFMAIVIPVAVQGLRIASRAGEVAERKREAVRVAERLLNENLVTTNLLAAAQSGVVRELEREYRWTLRSEPWIESTMQLWSVEVVFPVQGQDYAVELSTLASSTAGAISSTSTQ